MLGPLLVFAPQLAQAKRTGNREYGTSGYHQLEVEFELASGIRYPVSDPYWTKVQYTALPGFAKREGLIVSRKRAEHVLSPSTEFILSAVEGLRINSIEGGANE